MLFIGVPLLAGLSVMHGLVPPHPGAMAAIGMLKANVGRTIFYALLIGSADRCYRRARCWRALSPARVPFEPSGGVAAQFTQPPAARRAAAASRSRCSRPCCRWP